MNYSQSSITKLPISSVSPILQKQAYSSTLHQPCNKDLRISYLQQYQINQVKQQYDSNIDRSRTRDALRNITDKYGFIWDEQGKLKKVQHGQYNKWHYHGNGDNDSNNDNSNVNQSIMHMHMRTMPNNISNTNINSSSSNKYSHKYVGDKNNRHREHTTKQSDIYDNSEHTNNWDYSRKYNKTYEQASMNVNKNSHNDYNDDNNYNSNNKQNESNPALQQKQIDDKIKTIWNKYRCANFEPSEDTCKARSHSTMAKHSTRDQHMNAYKHSIHSIRSDKDKQIQNCYKRQNNSIVYSDITVEIEKECSGVYHQIQSKYGQKQLSDKFTVNSQNRQYITTATVSPAKSMHAAQSNNVPRISNNVQQKLNSNKITIQNSSKQLTPKNITPKQITPKHITPHKTRPQHYDDRIDQITLKIKRCEQAKQKLNIVHTKFDVQRVSRSKSPIKARSPLSTSVSASTFKNKIRDASLRYQSSHRQSPAEVVMNKRSPAKIMNRNMVCNIDMRQRQYEQQRCMTDKQSLNPIAEVSQSFSFEEADRSRSYQNISLQPTNNNANNNQTNNNTNCSLRVKIDKFYSKDTVKIRKQAATQASFKQDGNTHKNNHKQCIHTQTSELQSFNNQNIHKLQLSIEKQPIISVNNPQTRWHDREPQLSIGCDNIPLVHTVQPRKQKDSDDDRPQLIAAIVKQIQLDEQFRNSRAWFYHNDDPYKWGILNDQILLLNTNSNRDQKQNTYQQQLNLKFNYHELVQRFESVAEQRNPFFSLRDSHQNYQTLINGYVAADNHWHNSIANKFDEVCLDKEKFTSNQLDVQNKGKLKVQDLVRYLNMKTQSFFRNRDLILIFQRLAGRNKAQVQYSQIIRILTK